MYQPRGFWQDHLGSNFVNKRAFHFKETLPLTLFQVGPKIDKAGVPLLPLSGHILIHRSNWTNLEVGYQADPCCDLKNAVSTDFRSMVILGIGGCGALQLEYRLKTRNGQTWAHTCKAMIKHKHTCS